MDRLFRSVAFRGCLLLWGSIWDRALSWTGALACFCPKFVSFL